MTVKGLHSKISELACELWHRRPVITLHSRVQNAIDEADVTGYLAGRKSALEEIGAYEPVEATHEVAVLMGSIAGKIGTGQITQYDLRTALAALDGMANPQPKRHAVRKTTGGYALAVVAS